MKLQMGIIKIEIKIPELVKAVESFKSNRLEALEHLTEEIKNGVGDLYNQLLKTEMEIFLGHPDEVDNKRNGYQEREYALKGVGCVRIRMPVDRKRRFKSAIVPAEKFHKTGSSQFQNWEPVDFTIGSHLIS